MSGEGSGGPARALTVRLTPLGRTFQLSALTALVLAEVVALGDAAQSGGLRAGTLLFVPLLALALTWLAPLLSWLHLRGLSAETEPVTGSAGDEVVLPLHLENRSRSWTARDVVVSAGRARASVVRPVGFAAELAPLASATVPLAWRLARRGRWRSVHLSLLSTFPFGLAEARLALVLDADVLALPQRGGLREPVSLAAVGTGSREARRVARAGTAELRGLREWRPGEDEHLIHWKVSARRGKRVLRELGGEERSVVRLVLVGAVDALPPVRGEEPVWHEAFERAVSLTATLAEVLAQSHPAVRLVFLGATALELPEVRARGQLDPLLETLAEVQPHAGAPEDVLARVGEARRLGEVTLVVHAGTLPGLRALDGVAAIDASQAEGRRLWVPARREAQAWAAAERVAP